MLTKEQQLQDRARRCRELADTAVSEQGRSILCGIALRYENEASGGEVPRKRAALPEAAA